MKKLVFAFLLFSGSANAALLEVCTSPCNIGGALQQPGYVVSNTAPDPSTFTPACPLPCQLPPNTEIIADPALIGTTAAGASLSAGQY